MLGSYIGRPSVLPRYEGLPGVGSPQPPDSPIKIAGHYIQSLRRQSRVRGRFIITILGIFFLLFVFTAKRHQADIQQYVSARLNSHYYEKAQLQKSRWQDDDRDNPDGATSSKPNFHLLLKSKASSYNLCQAVLSAAVLDYPPPTLIGHDLTSEEVQRESSAIDDIFDYLQGKEAHDDDIVLIMDENTWLQLPPELMIDRFEELLSASDHRLLEKYGTQKQDSSTRTQISFHPPKYTQKVIFGASKICAGNLTADLACSAVPFSTLPKDIYGINTDNSLEPAYTRPRYLHAHNAMGRVKDLRYLYGSALRTLEVNSESETVGDHVLSDLYGKQEALREIERKSSLSFGATWREWFADKFGAPTPSFNIADAELHNVVTISSEISSEFGIGVDYESSIFQTMKDSASDIHFIKFDQPTMIDSPSKIAAKSFASPLQIPSDLNRTAPPFQQVEDSARTSVSPASEFDQLPLEAQWTDVGLATNVIVPGSKVPVALGFTGEEVLPHELWRSMWYQPHARGLMRRYLRSPQGKGAAEAAADGGGRWWDLRGGKGGVWTIKGEWYSWNELCREFDGAVFGDGKGDERVKGEEKESAQKKGKPGS